MAVRLGPQLVLRSHACLGRDRTTARSDCGQKIRDLAIERLRNRKPAMKARDIVGKRVKYLRQTYDAGAKKAALLQWDHIRD